MKCPGTAYCLSLFFSLFKSLHWSSSVVVCCPSCVFIYEHFYMFNFFKTTSLMVRRLLLKELYNLRNINCKIHDVYNHRATWVGSNMQTIFKHILPYSPVRKNQNNHEAIYYDCKITYFFNPIYIWGKLTTWLWF